MSKRTSEMMTIVVILTLIGGCAGSTTTETDPRFGESLNTLKAQQTLNPEASRNTNPVAGIDAALELLAGRGAAVRRGPRWCMA